SKVSEFVSGGDMAVFNGRIHTLEPSQPEVEAALIRAGRIVFLGSTADVLARASSDATPVDLEGRFALPGFIDSHVHFWRTGLMDQMVDLRESGSIAAVQDAIREAART